MTLNTQQLSELALAQLYIVETSSNAELLGQLGVSFCWQAYADSYIPNIELLLEQTHSKHGLIGADLSLSTLWGCEAARFGFDCLIASLDDLAQFIDPDKDKFALQGCFLIALPRQSAKLRQSLSSAVLSARTQLFDRIKSLASPCSEEVQNLILAQSLELHQKRSHKAKAFAQYLRCHPCGLRVSYPSLLHPTRDQAQYRRAQRYFRRGYGPVITVSELPSTLKARFMSAEILSLVHGAPVSLEIRSVNEEATLRIMMGAETDLDRCVAFFEKLFVVAEN